MAYYYYYQQHQTPSESLSPGAMVTDLTPLLLLSPSQQQHQLNLPLLTPILPSSTTPVSMTTTTATTENDQLPTPNTFIRHCEDMGLFHDLQNIVVMSSLSGPQNDTITTAVPVTSITTNSKMVTTSSSIAQLTNSNVVFSSSSSPNVTTMMMSNPFDETFKQAVLQQQNSDTNHSEHIFNNYKNHNNDDLNTPFIAPTTAVEISNSNNNTILKEATLTNTTNNVVESPISVEPMTTTMSRQENNMFMTTESIQQVTSAGNVLLMMMEEQESQQHISIQAQHSRIVEPRQKVIVPTPTTMMTDVGTTITNRDQEYCDEDENVDIVGIGNGNETTAIKQALKRNLLVKRLIQGQQNSSLVSKKSEWLQQQNIKVNDVIHPISNKQDNQYCNKINDDNQKQKQKQELLERNRSAAKRCRIKRKQRWDLLSEENRKLKAENCRLRNALAKLVTNGCGDGQQQIHNIT